MNDCISPLYTNVTMYLCPSPDLHYNDVIMSTMASQITSLTIVYWTVYSIPKSKKTSKLYVTGLRGIHRWSVNSPHKGPLTRKMFPFDDLISVSKRGPRILPISFRLTSLWLTYDRPSAYKTIFKNTGSQRPLESTKISGIFYWGS